MVCKKRWGGSKNKDFKWVEKAYEKYTTHKQTLAELKAEYQKDYKTLRKYFDNFNPITGEIIIPNKPVNLIMDATFFSRSDGVLICRANHKNLLWRKVESEKIDHYEKLLNDLIFAGVKFSSFVIDGRRGVLHLLLKKFPDIPVQFCQFHQLQIITRYLSRRPKLLAGKELRKLALTLAKTDRITFTVALNLWWWQWRSFLIEKAKNPETEKWHYRHTRLRSAYRSLKTNLPWLFTYQDFPNLSIPNTTNSCDGSFAHWKNKIRIHRGLRQDRRDKMLHFFLENS